MNKKAVSPVVATVLIVLIVIACVGVLWVALYPILNPQPQFKITKEVCVNKSYKTDRHSIDQLDYLKLSDIYLKKEMIKTLELNIGYMPNIKT